MRSPHPYKKYENSDAWKVVSQALQELEENGDLTVTTAREYLVGYLCEQLAKAEKADARPRAAFWTPGRKPARPHLSRSARG